MIDPYFDPERQRFMNRELRSKLDILSSEELEEVKDYVESQLQILNEDDDDELNDEDEDEDEDEVDETSESEDELEVNDEVREKVKIDTDDI